MNETENTKTITILEDYSVVCADKTHLLEFFKSPENLDELYGVIEAKAKGLVADVSTKEGIAQIKSCARQIASVKKRVDDFGKDVVSELKALPKVIDENRRIFREKMETLQDEIRKPVTEIEERQKELERIAGIHTNLIGAGSDEIKTEISKLEEIEVTEEKWKESTEKAKTVIEGEMNALHVLLDAAVKRENEARELEELRKKQEEAERIIREQKIREEAERKAKEEAEAKARAEKERLEREKAEAERRAEEAEKARIEAEKREEETRKNQATASVDFPVFQGAAPTPTPTAPIPSAPSPRPSKWTPEMKAVNSGILETITKIINDTIPNYIAGHSEQGYNLAATETAKMIVKAIANGKIAHLEVRY